MITLAIISASILLSYIAVSISLFGVPKSLSETFYLYRYNLDCGYIFQIILGLSAALMLPCMLQASEGSDFQFLAFFSVAALLFVAAAPKFKQDFEGKVHSYSAIIAALSSILWVILVAHQPAILVGAILFVFILSIMTTRITKNYIFLLEMIAFIATYATLIKIL